MAQVGATQKKTGPQAGFTLMELSMVLVIIGLIIGAIMIGQNLIAMAGVRGTVAQIEKYNSAVNTFKLHYNGMPGDIFHRTATKFSLTSRSGAPGHGDGNGLVEGCGADAKLAGCETLLFWVDLHAANLVDGSFTTATDALAEIPTGTQIMYFPTVKLRYGTFATVYTDGGVNYFHVGGIQSTDNAGEYSLSYTISPTEAFNMDNKIDDGLPLTGHFRALEELDELGVAATPSATSCVLNITSNPYNMSPSYADVPLCHARFRVQQ